MKHRVVYLDHAAATPLDPKAKKAMDSVFTDYFANPSSFHGAGKEVKDILEQAREKVAEVLNAHTEEIIFTSGGTESDNLAILGFARANSQHGKHIITSKTEHPAVLSAVKHLVEKEGFSATYLEVDRDGLINVDELLAAISPETILISVMLANNEIGTIAPIAEISMSLKKVRETSGLQFPAFHTDACQAAGSLDLNVEKLGVDMMTINSSKIYGPKGVGALYLRRGLKIQSLQFGGHQERNLRPGTENVAGIVGFAKALELADLKRESYSKKTTVLRDYLIEGILKSIPKTRLNGHPTKRLPNNANISFLDVEGEALLLYLDAAGIYASSGSACTSQSLDPSHVILALGVPFEVAHGSIRFSLGRETRKSDIDYVLKTLPGIVEKLRLMSPVQVDAKYF